MKITRQKKVRKHISFFCNTYGFRQPYQTLIDGTLCYAALKNKVNLRDQLPKYLEGEVKLLTTQCVILEIEKLGSSVHGAMLIVKQFGIHKCGHNEKPMSASACLESMLGVKNASRYIIATQDRELQGKARRIPGTPVLYLHQKAPTLQPPSHVSIRMANLNSKAMFDVSKHQGDALQEMKKEKLGHVESENVKKKKKKKSGPNPLSCKKKQKKNAEQRTETGTHIKRNRKRLKVPKHLKEHWMSLVKQECGSKT